MEQIRLEATVYFVLESTVSVRDSIARPGRSPFYAITAGRCNLVLGRKTYELSEGDFVLLPSGAPHVMRGAKDAPIVALDDWMRLHPKERVRLYTHRRARSGAMRSPAVFSHSQR